jgi:hypothetical protein
MAQRLILASILAALLVGPAARAQSLDSRERTARTSCLSGDYARGVAILSELFVDTRDPTHIYNQGRCFEQNRRFEEAIARFEEYLRVGTKLGAEEIATAKQHISDCQHRIGGETSPAARPPSAVPVPPPPTSVAAAPPVESVAATATPPATPTDSAASPGRGLRIAGIVAGAGGVAIVAAGVGLTLKANSMASDMEKLDAYTPDKESSRKTYRNLGMVAYGVGAAGIATGLVLSFLGYRAAATEAPRVALSPLVAPGATGAVISGAF